MTVLGRDAMVSVTEDRFAPGGIKRFGDFAVAVFESAFPESLEDQD